MTEILKTASIYIPLEVTLNNPDDFLKVRETLTRIGVESKKKKILYQSCHIFHKQSHYFIVHFKELFALDGKTTDISENDIQRRNTIAKLLSDWELIKIIDPENFQDYAPLSQIKVLNFSEKDEYTLMPKYTIGRKIINGNR